MIPQDPDTFFGEFSELISAERSRRVDELCMHFDVEPDTPVTSELQQALDMFCNEFNAHISYIVGYA